MFAQSNGIEYFYDENSAPIAFAYLGEVYYYKKDLLGNVIEILDTTGATVVKYTYDAWGNHKVLNPDGTENTSAMFIGNINPIRYRSYYFDTETGSYYLQTRYYDPQIGRFINIDDISYLDPESINGLNLYAYCGDNPIEYFDPNGQWSMPNWLKWVVGVVVIVGLGIATVFTGGAAGVILGAAFYGALTSAIGGALVGGIVDGISTAIAGGSFWSGFADGAASGFMSGAIIGGLTGALCAGINIGLGTISGGRLGTTIYGSAQKTGTLFHRMASNIEAGKMAMQVGRYSQITLDRSLNKAGLVGRKMPDVIGTARWGKNLLVEVTSKSQTYAQMARKLTNIVLANPNTKWKVIGWAAWIAKLFT